MKWCQLRRVDTTKNRGIPAGHTRLKRAGPAGTVKMLQTAGTLQNKNITYQISNITYLNNSSYASGRTAPPYTAVYPLPGRSGKGTKFRTAV